jgi:UDP-N-acetylglucosamine transferase subunit ALG13
VSAPGSSPQIVVSLGTDHHRFDRLVDWIDDWLAGIPNPPGCLVQYGASRPPRYADGVTRMPREDLLALYSEAAVVVVQGGPGSILDAREVGHLPIAIPRKPELHEVVDNHQAAFTQIMVLQGQAIGVQTKESLVAELEKALRDPSSVRTAPRVSPAGAAAERLGAAIDRLEKTPTGPIALRRIHQLLTVRGAHMQAVTGSSDSRAVRN